MQQKIGKALVVGAGISGIRCALDLAETGYGVILIDWSTHLGGVLSQLERQFPTNRCGMCQMLPLIERDSSAQFCLRKGLFHENIEIRTGTRLTALAGEPGHLKVDLRRSPNWIDPQRCIGCGKCVDVCPVQVPDDYNAGLSTRKAIYLPVPHAVPNPYVIDTAACTGCGECQTICPTQAIDLARDHRLQFRIIVVDDELIVRDSLKEWLVDEGFSVDMAESGADALQCLKSNSYHLMLTDIKMPGMDGVELLGRAKEIAPEMIVVMMTAYATVETAVDAMKIGARDYLMKPFDPEKLMPMVNAIFEEIVAGQDESLDVGAVILACGADYVDPADGKNPYGYKQIPHVVTHLEFERLLSGTGPFDGRLLRPADQKPVQRLAFLQCVGSRDLDQKADFCSSVCCMIAVKEALLAKEVGGAHLDTAVFYMDMRASGLPYQRFCDQARTEHQVRFERGRIHSVTTDQHGDPVLRYVSAEGRIVCEVFDMVVLAAGQRPAKATPFLAEIAGLSTNAWHFLQNTPFSTSKTDNSAVMTAGCNGLKDISESIIQASAAASEVGRCLHAAGGSLELKTLARDNVLRDVWAEPPRIFAAICTCDKGFYQQVPESRFRFFLDREPAVAEVFLSDKMCSKKGWQTLTEKVQETQPNRILVGACHPYLMTGKLKSLAADCGLTDRLVEAVDLRIHMGQSSHQAVSMLSSAITRLKYVNPRPVTEQPVFQKALVIGGGIAGMQAALSIAHQGYPVCIIEKASHLGGHLNWLRHTLDGRDFAPLLSETIKAVEKHPHIEVLLETQVRAAFGQVGAFYTTVETRGKPAKILEHGAVVIATGGHEARTAAYHHGAHPAVMTQKAFETGLTDNTLDPGQWHTVVMILCVDSRQEPRNYCSRICCPTAIKQALEIKKRNPDVAVYVLYRDMMTSGFTETYFTRARQAGVVFIAYDLDQMPEVTCQNETDVSVQVYDAIIERRLSIQTDIVILATGIQPALPDSLAAAYEIQTDQDGFFKPADFKWRPVDALTEGVFACGISHSPRDVTETIATAQAAAQRAMRILVRPTVMAGKVTARVRHSLCSRCESCIPTCPYGARTLDEQSERILVNPVRCQGCGACSTVCPNSAATLDGFSDRQMMETIESVLSY